MAGLRYYHRRARRLLSSKAIQVSSIAIVLFLGVQWLITHNHDNSAASPVVPRPTARVDDKKIDWSKLYYVQHVTTPENLCSALMIWASIQLIGSRAQRLMLYPSAWDIEATDPSDNVTLTSTARMLQQAKSLYYVKLRPLDSLNPNATIWSSEPYTPLLSYNLTEFNRVLAIDPASVVKKNLDELFLIPAAPLAMPHIYWGGLEDWGFSSQLMLMTPSASSFDRVTEAVTGVAKGGEDPITILENLFHGSILKIPQRPFALLSGEYRRSTHDEYIGVRSPRTWSVRGSLNEARILYFSDFPLPKPWKRAKQEVVNRYMPKCERSEWFGASDCEARTRWLGMYSEYREHRRAVCGMEFEAEVQEKLEEGADKRRERRFYEN